MESLHIITPVKDSIEFTLETIKAILDSEIKVPYTYTVYNDFSTPENTKILEENAKQLGFRLVNLSDLTDHPSPNYLLVLQMAQKEAIEAKAGLLIVESDVVVKKNTLQGLFDGAVARPDCAIAAAVTTDEAGVINYPYLHAKGNENKIYAEKKHCSFCCSLLTLDFAEVRLPSAGCLEELVRCDHFSRSLEKRFSELFVYGIAGMASPARKPAMETVEIQESLEILLVEVYERVG